MSSVNSSSNKSIRPSNLLSIKESQVRRERPMSGYGLWRLGFRPFYLGAALFSAAAIMVWLSVLFGTFNLPHSSIYPLFWHAHEMVFGFAFAVIAGFLLTASNNWTGILPAAGLPLAILFLLWAAARVFMLLGDVALAAMADLAFAALLLALLGRVLWLAQLWKNFLLVGLVGLIGALNVWFYAIILNDIPMALLTPIELALLAVMQLLVVMGGRVIPMFTQNGVLGIRVWKPDFFVSATPLASLLGIVGWLTMPSRIAVVCCAIATAVNLARWIGWKPWQTHRQPMVWVLHLGYLWIPVTFVAMGLESLGVVPRSLPVHTLALGAMGLIIAGMITRTAMGHTGRPIIATWIEKSFFALVSVSAVLRTLAALPVLQTPTLTPMLLMISGSAWSVAFALYLWRYGPWLFRPRLDGRPG